MKLNKLKEMSSKILGKSKYKLIIDDVSYAKNKEKVDKAITKEDVRSIIKLNVVKKKTDTGLSRGRARILLKKKKLKRKRGPGKRKGTAKARKNTNEYNLKVRGLRKKLKNIKEKDELKGKKYAKLYLMIKGNYFRGKKHLQDYINGEKK